MFRYVAPVAVLATVVLSGTTAHAEEAELQQKFLVSTRAYSSVYTTVEQAPPSSVTVAGTLYPGANVGVRLSLGQGRWSSNPQVFLGWSPIDGTLVEGWSVGIWGRNDSPTPAVDERYGAAYGLSFTEYKNTSRGNLVENTYEAGVRMSIAADGSHSTANGDPLGQAVVGFASQVLILDDILVGPAGEVRIGNDRAPWVITAGIRMSI